MRTVKTQRRTETAGLLDRPDREGSDVEEADDAGEFDEGALRVACPDCAQPIALPAAGRPLPVHGLCPTPWDPFGLTVCGGSGRVVTGEAGAPGTRPESAAGGEAAIRTALPEGLDWRLQPFSHAAGPGPGPGAGAAPTLAAPPPPVPPPTPVAPTVAPTNVRTRRARQARLPRLRQAA